MIQIIISTVAFLLHKLEKSLSLHLLLPTAGEVIDLTQFSRTKRKKKFVF